MFVLQMKPRARVQRGTPIQNKLSQRGTMADSSVSNILSRLMEEKHTFTYKKLVVPMSMRSPYWKYYGFPATEDGDILTKVCWFSIHLHQFLNYQCFCIHKCLFYHRCFSFVNNCWLNVFLLRWRLFVSYVKPNWLITRTQAIYVCTSKIGMPRSLWS